jgi:hypothetical protein
LWSPLDRNRRDIPMTVDKRLWRNRSFGSLTAGSLARAWLTAKVGLISSGDDRESRFDEIREDAWDLGRILGGRVT